MLSYDFTSPHLSQASQNRQTSPATQREERLREMEGGAIVAVSGDGKRGGGGNKKDDSKKAWPSSNIVFRLCIRGLRAEATVSVLNLAG